MSQSNERKAAPREVKKPLATVPPPTIYILSKNSPCSLNIQVGLTSLTLLASVSMSMLLDSRATGMFINWSFMQKHQLETTLLPQPVLMCNVNSSPNENGSVMEEVQISLCRSLPPLHPSDKRMPSMRSFSLWNGRNTSVPPQPPHRD